MDLSTDVGDTMYKGHLPLIKDSSVVQKGGRLQKVRKSYKDESGMKTGEWAEETTNYSETWKDEYVNAKEGIETRRPENLENAENLDLTRTEKEYMRFPKMKTDNFDGQKMQGEADTIQQRMQFGGFDAEGQEHTLPSLNSPLLPFEVRDAGSQQNGLGMLRRKDASSLPKSASNNVPKKSNNYKESGLSKKQNGVDQTQRLKDEMKLMKFRKSSVFSKHSPMATTDFQRDLYSEAYCMQRMHFTSNFTFSFFDMPPVYEEQSELLRKGGNMIGKRKVRPKFTKPLGKTPAKVIRPIKTNA